MKLICPLCGETYETVIQREQDWNGICSGECWDWFLGL